jgi:hypothetical protein
MVDERLQLHLLEVQAKPNLQCMSAAPLLEALYPRLAAGSLQHAMRAHGVTGAAPGGTRDVPQPLRPPSGNGGSCAGRHVEHFAAEEAAGGAAEAESRSGAGSVGDLAQHSSSRSCNSSTSLSVAGGVAPGDDYGDSEPKARQPERAGREEHRADMFEVIVNEKEGFLFE